MTVANDKISKVNNSAFECIANGNGKLALLSIDDGFLNVLNNQITIDSSIGNISGIYSTKLKSIIFNNDTGYLLSNYVDHIS